MHPPPQLHILRKMQGSPLCNVSIGLYEAHLTFENGNRLTLSAPFRFEKNRNILAAKLFEFPIQEEHLVRVIGKMISEIACESDGTLDIIFDSGDRLIVYANDPMYEAYTLLIDGDEHVI